MVMYDWTSYQIIGLDPNKARPTKEESIKKAVSKDQDLVILRWSMPAEMVMSMWNASRDDRNDVEKLLLYYE